MYCKNITIVNQVEQLDVLAEALETVSDEWKIPLDVILRLNLVLEELVTNVIFYGFDDKNEHEINIHLSYEGKIFKMQIEDEGKEFNPTLVPAPDMDKTIETSKIGGLGIHFVRKIMDTVSYQRLNNKNILSLTKHIE